MHHDERRWESPSDFAPERYAQHPKLAPHYASGGGDGDDGPGRDHFGYGAGRRVCPGIHLAERNLFLAAAKLLWAFEFDKRGAEEGPSSRVESGGGFLQCVADYECVVTPRSEGRAETIRREFREAGLVFSEYD